MKSLSRVASRTGKRLLLLSFSLVIACVLIEIALRLIGYSPAVTAPLTGFHVSHDRLGWSGIPNYSARFKTLNFDSFVQLNDAGFRTVTSKVTPEDGAPEVWMFGDSTTWGWGVSNGEIFADVLQEKVGSSLRIENFGINAYGTVQELLLFEELLGRRNPPEKVILMVCENDFADNLTDQSGARPCLKAVDTAEGFEIANLPVTRRIGGASASLTRFSYAWSFFSYCSSLYKQIRTRRQYEDMFTGSWETADITPEGTDPNRIAEEPYEAIRFVLQRFDALCRQHRIELDVISFPQVTSPYLKTSASVALEEICGELKANVVDIESGMSEDRIKYYIGGNDTHWNAAGNRKGAEVYMDRVGPRLGLDLEESKADSSKPKKENGSVRRAPLIEAFDVAKECWVDGFFIRSGAVVRLLGDRTAIFRRASDAALGSEEVSSVAPRSIAQ